jgi:hypothetical protein
MMPSAKIVICDRFFPGEHVVEAEHRVLRLIGEKRQCIVVHARCGDVTADPIYREQAQREEHPLAQVRHREDVFQTVSQHVCLPAISRPARQVKAPAYRRLRQHLGPAASRRDLFRRLGAELVRLHRERLADVATCQNLDIPATGRPNRARAGVPE